MKTRKKLKTAVIGCGNIGADESIYGKDIRPGTHAGAYSANSKTKLVALSDIDHTKLAEAGKNFPDVKLYKDVKEMLLKEKLDIVSIATPAKSHCQLIKLATRGGIKTILCEKPLSLNVKEAEEIVKFCKKNKSQLFVNHQRHFDPTLCEWSEKIKKGFLGKIFQGNSYYCNGFINNGTHVVDLIRMFLGEPVYVIGEYNKKTGGKKEDPNIDGILFFKNGTVATLQSLSKNYDFYDIRIIGEKGIINITELGEKIEYRKKEKSSSYERYFKLSPKISVFGKPRNIMKGAIDYVVAFANGEKKAISTGEDGLAVLKILRAMKKSADLNGKKICLKQTIT